MKNMMYYYYYINYVKLKVKKKFLAKKNYSAKYKKLLLLVYIKTIYYY
jgi:hypothetical protein